MNYSGTQDGVITFSRSGMFMFWCNGIFTNGGDPDQDLEAQVQLLHNNTGDTHDSTFTNWTQPTPGSIMIQSIANHEGSGTVDKNTNSIYTPLFIEPNQIPYKVCLLFTQNCEEPYFDEDDCKIFIWRL